MPSVDLDLDEYELRARAMQGMEATHRSMSLIPIAAPGGLSSVSSIRPTEKETPIPQHRPSLAAPNIMHALIATYNKTESLLNKRAQIFDVEVSKAMADIDKLSTEKQEALEKEVEAVKARETWSTLSNIAQYIMSIGTITLGFALGGIPGLCLGLAGGVGITNRVAHDTNLLQAGVEWYTKSNELQRKITQTIEMGAFFLQMGLGLAGGILAWQSGALSAAQVNGAVVQKKVESVLAGAGGVVSATSRVGMSYYDKKMAYLQAHMRDLDTQTVLDHQTLYHDSVQMSKMIELTQSEGDVMKRSIQAQEVSQD